MSSKDGSVAPKERINTKKVPATLDQQPETELPVNLDSQTPDNFSPDSIARQAPELQRLIELREELVALKGPLVNVPAFRSKLQDLLDKEQAEGKLPATLSKFSGSV